MLERGCERSVRRHEHRVEGACERDVAGVVRAQPEFEREGKSGSDEQPRRRNLEGKRASEVEPPRCGTGRKLAGSDIADQRLCDFRVNEIRGRDVRFARKEPTDPGAGGRFAHGERAHHNARVKDRA